MTRAKPQAKPEPLKIGELVTLNSSNVAMTVVAVTAENAIVYWLSLDEKPQQLDVPHAALNLVLRS